MAGQGRYTFRRCRGIVLVVDNCAAGCRSVTNDAENLIADLRGFGIDLDQNLIAYRDTIGRWDRLIARHAGFPGFAPL